MFLNCKIFYRYCHKFEHVSLWQLCSVFKSFHYIKLIEQFGVNIHIKNADGMTVFLLCCKENKLEEMKYFIEKGANINDIDAKGRNARQIAEDAGHLDIVKFIDSGFAIKE